MFDYPRLEKILNSGVTLIVEHYIQTVIGDNYETSAMRREFVSRNGLWLELLLLATREMLFCNNSRNLLSTLSSSRWKIWQLRNKIILEGLVTWHNAADPKKSKVTQPWYFFSYGHLLKLVKSWRSFKSMSLSSDAELSCEKCCWFLSFPDHFRTSY